MNTPPSRPRDRRLRPVLATAAASVLLLTAACAGEEAADDTTEAATVIDEERCEANRAAGTVTYITGYQYQASVSILEAVAADALGYFEAVCLDVEIQPGSGDTIGNSQLVSAGTAHFTSLGNEAEVLQANDAGHDVIGVATYGHVPIASLLTGTGIEELKDLEGTTLGHKGMLPAPLEAMLVADGVDLDSIEIVEVGYDPSVLPRDQVQALTAFRSNEPFLLSDMGEEYNEWLPEDYGVVGSFGVMATNPAWAEENPTAVEDYLRALSRAFTYCQENGEECVGYAAELAEAGYDVDHNLRIWTSESRLVTASTPDDATVGYIDLSLTEAEGQTLVDNGQLDKMPDVEPLFDPRYLEAVHIASEVSWPGE
ncbi:MULTISPECIES: ABC transporter substrate-binding protein [Nocardiopsis]|uniref:Myristoyl transferase n=1 Tax=Nocardiopsis sinuspersici TaxID=501010 RepID=A0A1V3C6R5_9ACTN|nr:MULTISPECIES: ABC transporter substrate-binding protein [Nocardiopsis]NYH53074.1 NitT/TauT family transport system substrate-binding protein [Nocardiopsis sinuspersici]OOC56445.1 myristoyl transferase [Nocardiopsis sinuspersici]